MLEILNGVALVTGAGSGVGRETAFGFAESGTKAILCADINEVTAQATAEKCKTFATAADFDAVAVKVDVSKEDEVQRMVNLCVKEFVRIDYFVNSAGMGNPSFAPTQSLKLDVFDETIETNTRGCVLCLRAVTEAMSKQEPLEYQNRRGKTRSLGKGAIVNVGSIMSFLPGAGMMGYTTSKHALIGATKTAAIDGFIDHIRVNIVCPSWVDTAMFQATCQRVPHMEQLLKAVVPLKRPADAEEVADAILFLCGPRATYINGTSLLIDAGTTIAPGAKM